MTTLRLIVGLGNPGPEYAATRHNAGQWFVERLADKYGIRLSPEPKYFGISGRGTVNGQPQTPWTPPQQLTVKPKPLGWEELLMGVVALGIILL